MRLCLWKQLKSPLSSSWNFMQCKTVNLGADPLQIGWGCESGKELCCPVWLAACAAWGSSCRGETMSPQLLLPCRAIGSETQQLDVVTGVKGRRAWRQRPWLDCVETLHQREILCVLRKMTQMFVCKNLVFSLKSVATNSVAWMAGFSRQGWLQWVLCTVWRGAGTC